MEEKDRERIRDDLKGIIKGDLLFDDIARILYSTDASIFHVRPLGIAVPRDEDDVQALVRYAGEHRLPLIARGAGSGFAGESLGSGLIVDMSRHFRSIVEIASDHVRVEPGVVHRHLNAELRNVGRRFAPDPASGDQCTVGGMVATNASGTRLLRHGYTREYVLGIRVVLDTGDAVSVGRHSFDSNGRQTSGHLDDIVVSVGALLQEHSSLIQASQPRTPFNRCGYLLHDVLTPGGVDIARLLVGSEGTLAISTQITLRTIPLPVERSLVVFSFADLDAALRASAQAVTTRPSACELLDHRLLTLARGTDGLRYVPSAAHAALLVEYESDTAGEAREAAVALADWLRRTQRLALHSHTALDDDEIERIWAMRAEAVDRLFQLRGNVQAVPLVEDVGVPVNDLPSFLHRVQDILQRHDTTAAFLVHAGTGQVHTRPFLDLENPEHVSRLWAIADEIHSAALELGGTVSTQHGTGLARTPWISRQYGRLHPMLRDIKSIFDPRGIFNPGKIIGSEPDQLTWRLRGRVKLPEIAAQDVSAAEVPIVDLLTSVPESFALRWQPSEFRYEAASCTGCGACRTEASHQRMCPIFRASLSEDATPRAKANLMRALLEGDAEAPPLSAAEVRDVANLCVNCKMCASECPAHVNIPKLMLEAKAANVAEHGLDRSDWVLARAESFAAFGSAFAFLVNAALGSRGCRWVMEKLFGVARKRRLPAFTARSFLRRASRRGWARQPVSDRPRVAYFVDVFANYNDPQIGEAVVAVLQHHDIDVHVPLGQVGCGIAALAQGDVDTAREAAKKNLRVLADIAREGHAIVCSEPTAALMLRQDYLNLLDDPDAKLVAERTVELTDFLGELQRLGRLRTNFRQLPLSIGHHVPCHLKALGRPPAAPQLLSLIPGMTVRTIDVSCSGMAGTFGLKAENYEMSLKAGEPMLREFSQPDIRFGSSECSACRMQMEEGGRKRALHPIQYLALAYGLMPELSRRLEKPMNALVLR